MGEIADDIVNGLSCSCCGVYFERKHGYPVLCSDCFEDENIDLPEAIIPQL